MSPDDPKHGIWTLADAVAGLSEDAGPDLVAKIDSTGKALGDLLETYRDGDGFKLYTDLTEDDVKKLTQALDAFSENVAQVAGVVAKA